MRSIVKVIKYILLIVWLLASIVSTICLLTSDEYGVSKIKNYSVFIINNNRLKPNFRNHDLVIVKNIDISKYNSGEMIIYCLDEMKDDSYIDVGTILSITKESNSNISVFLDNNQISNSKILGKVNEANVYHNWGLILSIFESRWGFMFLVIFPAVFLIIYEVYNIINEFKK